MMVYGDSLKNCIVAIVVPDEEFLKIWNAKSGKKLTLSTANADPDFKKEVMDDILEL